MSYRTAEETVEYLNDAAEYANLDIEFDYEDEDKDSFVLIHGKNKSRNRVDTDLMYGYAKQIPDQASVEHFANAIINSLILGK